MPSDNYTRIVDDAIAEADLLALAIATGTLKTTTPTTPTAHQGDYILNVRKTRGTTDRHTIMQGRITSIRPNARAFEDSRYLGRIDGSCGWITKIIEPSHATPRIHNTLIIITNLDGIACDIPALYDANTDAYRLITAGSRTHPSTPTWAHVDQIRAWSTARVIAA